MNFNYDLIPNEMKSLKRWVLWKRKYINSEQTTKVPINVRNGYGAKSNDSETWATFDEALKNVEYYQCDGLGFMLGGGYFGVDIDHSMSDKDLINEFVNTLNSYTEISQSGDGIHIICKGVLPVGNRRKGHIEMYDNARFFALTGNVYENHTRIMERTQEVKVLHTKYLCDKPKEIPEGAYVYEPITRKESNTMSSLSDEEVITKATESKTGNLFNLLYCGQWEGLYPSQSEADMAFTSLLAFWCARDEIQIDRIFRNSKLYREKWDLKRGANTYGEITIRNAISKCKDIYTPAITPVQVYNPTTGEVVKNKEYDLNDTGNAQRFIDRFGSDIRYNFDNKTWVVYDGKTWIKDVKQLVKTKCDILIEEMKTELLKEPDENKRKELARNIKHVSSNSGKEAMLKEAMHIGTMPTVNADYDKDEYLFNCFNGVIDLKTGRLLEHNKTFMLSKYSNTRVDLENEPTRWKQFLLEIFNNNQELVDYIQVALGYTLTGSTKEQCFFQCYGDGANGKSVFLDIIYKMLGDYALNAQVESILAKGNNNSGASSEIARMNGARFVRTNEPNEGARFNEGLVKQLVSGDVTTARFLYGAEFEFTPKFKLWIATNYKINVRGTDYGIWRRQRLVPFEVKFEGAKADKKLSEKLEQELPQILGWCVKGAVKWRESGLITPKQIEIANNEYKNEMDTIRTFMNDCTIENPQSREKASEVYKEYAEWAKNGHEYCMTQTKFGIEMAKKYIKKNVNGYVYYYGFMLKKNDERYIYENCNVNE